MYKGTLNIVLIKMVTKTESNDCKIILNDIKTVTYDVDNRAFNV